MGFGQCRRSLAWRCKRGLRACDERRGAGGRVRAGGGVQAGGGVHACAGRRPRGGRMAGDPPIFLGGFQGWVFHGGRPAGAPSAWGVGAIQSEHRCRRRREDCVVRSERGLGRLPGLGQSGA